MNAPLFSEVDLHSLCSETTLAKARMLHENGAVLRLCWQGEQLNARVRGSGENLYLVQIDQAARFFSCTCPAAEYQVLCKHVAAVVMQVNSCDSVSDEDSETEQVRALLAQQSPEQLVALILELLEDNPNQWRKWQLKAQLAEQGPDLRQLKKLITKALPARGVWEWDRVRNYFECAEQQFKAIWSAQEQLPEAQQFELTEHALRRLNKVLEKIDDSGGFRFVIEARLYEMLTDQFAQLTWPAKKKAGWLLGHLQDPLNLFPALPEGFTLDGETLAALCEGCEKALQSALETPIDKDDDGYFLWDWHLNRLAKPLLQAAEQQDNWREQERIKAQLVSRYDDYLELSDLCLAHDEALDAEHWLTKALKTAKGAHEHRGCQRHQIKVLIALNEQASAWKLAWQLFSAQPGFEAYQSLAELHRQLGKPQSDFLEQVEAQLALRGSSVLAFYLEQQQWDKARAWVAENEAPADRLLELADGIVAQHEDEAMGLYLRVVRAQIERTNNAAYQQALTQLQRLQQQWQAHQHSSARFDAAVAQLAEDYKQKRNMRALLQKHFGI